jgi:hypothetical protein
MNEYASSALLIRLAPDSGFNFIGVKDICGPVRYPIERLPIILSSKSAARHMMSGSPCYFTMATNPFA